MTEEIKKFNMGGIPDKPDERDYQWNNGEFGGALPPFDWNKGFDIEDELRNVLADVNFILKPNDQGQSESCGGQAWSKYAAVLYAFISKSFIENSAKFIYSQIFQLPAGGSQGRDNCNILINQGCADENLCVSYENNLPPSEVFMEKKLDITPEAISNAKFEEVLSYANVSPDIDEFAHAIANNHGMVIGFRISAGDQSWVSVYPKAPGANLQTSGHWVYAGKAKLINGQKMIGILNSWGEQIGESGWQWIGEDYFAENGTYLMYGWTLMVGTKPTISTFSHNFLLQMKFGDQNAEVRTLQQALQVDGDLPTTVQVTGYYGPATRQAIVKFQAKYSIPFTGGNNVGPITLEKLNELFNK